jgi:hypothetical protein
MLAHARAVMHSRHGKNGERVTVANKVLTAAAEL